VRSCREMKGCIVITVPRFLSVLCDDGYNVRTVMGPQRSSNSHYEFRMDEQMTSYIRWGGGGGERVRRISYYKLRKLSVVTAVHH
jgi:hypothetical protein